MEWRFAMRDSALHKSLRGATPPPGSAGGTGAYLYIRTLPQSFPHPNRRDNRDKLGQIGSQTVPLDTILRDKLGQTYRNVPVCHANVLSRCVSR